jgi:uncharacterized membrane protein YccF (DUF307 family)
VRLILEAHSTVVRNFVTCCTQDPLSARFWREFSFSLKRSMCGENSCCEPIKKIVWLVLGGFISAVLWWFFGLLLCLTIIGIPFGKQCCKMASLSLDPFGKEVKRDGVLCLSSGGACCCCDCIFNILWLPFGLVIAMNHLFLAMLFCITIIGVPCGYEHLKLADLAIWPFGTDLDSHVHDGCLC